MSTNSTLAVKHEDGTVSQIYCHWDGYPSHHAPILLNYYHTLESVEQLISFGDLSVLAERCTPSSEHHWFTTPDEGVCIYYGRDRGEDEVDPERFDNQDAFYVSRQDEEYNYYFVFDQWWLLVGNEIVPLSNIELED
jgi:hypothetical protein